MAIIFFVFNFLVVFSSIAVLKKMLKKYDEVTCAIMDSFADHIDESTHVGTKSVWGHDCVNIVNEEWFDDIALRWCS